MIVIVSRARWVELVSVLIPGQEDLRFIIYKGRIYLQKTAGPGIR